MIQETSPVVDARTLLLLRMEETIHGLSQPITSITFALELAAMPGEMDKRGDLLLSARFECERARACVVALREDVSMLLGTAKSVSRGMA